MRSTITLAQEFEQPSTNEALATKRGSRRHVLGAGATKLATRT
jgi:hypothetical protein